MLTKMPWYDTFNNISITESLYETLILQKL